MQTFHVEVTMHVQVTLDETKFTPSFMAEFRESFYPFHTLAEHAEHIAQLAARECHEFGQNRSEFVEGYGVIGDFGIKAEVKDTNMEVIE